MKIYNFLIFLRVQPYKRLLRLNIMVFCPEHPKRDQSLKFISLKFTLSETTSIPPISYAEYPPPPGYFPGPSCSKSG